MIVVDSDSLVFVLIFVFPITLVTFAAVGLSITAILEDIGIDATADQELKLIIWVTFEVVIAWIVGCMICGS